MRTPPSTPDTDRPGGDAQPPERIPLRRIAGLFLMLGTIAFGGPAAHIAMMEEHVVRRRRWLGRDEFLDLLGATNLIPGPNSTEMAIFIGHRRAGLRGLFVAGTCFILPAALLVSVVAWAYVRYGSLPQAQSILYGIKPVIIAVVMQALWGLGRAALKNRVLAVIGAAAFVASLAGADELLLLFAAGVVAAGGHWIRRRRQVASMTLFGVPLLGTIGASVATPVAFGLWPLFLFFLKVGSILFGSGYVLLAFLRADLVDRLGWLRESQLLDAVAIGQVTPGPLLTTATFIGYLLGGPAAASVATVGIFLPSFFFVAVAGPLVPRLRRSPAAAAFLDGVVAGSLALMAAVACLLFRAAVVDLPSATIAALTAILLIRFRLNSAWLVLGGALTGAGIRALH